MSYEGQEKRKPMNGFERHVQTVIQVLITALLLWVGSSVLSVRDSAIRLEEKYAQTRSDVGDIKTELAALRTQISVAAATSANAQQQIKDLEVRIIRLERVK